MSESILSKEVFRALRKLDPVLVENPKTPGTPDINYISGWVELKYRKEWPKRASSIVTFPKFTPKQRVWLVKRSLSGGKCFLFMQIKFMYILYEGGYAAQNLGKMTRDEILKNALYVWDHFPEVELAECLK